MKTAIRLSIICFTAIFLFACSGKKSSTAVANTTPPVTNPTPVASQPVQPKGTSSVRFVVSFFSKGEGIDLKTKEEFTKFLDSYPKKIGYEPVQWGREGELDYCLTLNNMNADEQTEFIKKAQVILSKSKLVHTKENSACEHSMQPPADNDDNYRLVISFYSKGGGIDYKTKEDFEKFLNSYPKKITFEPTGWGREGETDYCLKLTELSASEQADFVRKAKETLSKSALVHVNENAKCVHKL